MRWRPKTFAMCVLLTMVPRKQQSLRDQDLELSSRKRDERSSPDERKHATTPERPRSTEVLAAAWASL
jgi:hypothetical protein